ncbi:MAG: glutamate racemase [Erysipelotrichaceae bacterium]|nr:MAG: hypothetical protein FD179_1664 [Erysipelotrichaceae bacterium]TXT16655.1 MAG: glutamate racemase [Erysipelotrichaceae bacterium]
MTIGILDSGLGGYSVYHALRAAYPKAPFLFLADQLNAPYGDKSKDEIFKIVQEALAWFEKQQITEILVACNTISSLALSEIKPLYPHLKITGIIDLTVAQFKDKDYRKILVVATNATINSHAYQKEFSRIKPEVEVFEHALPRLVVQLEGLAPLEETETYLNETLAQYRNKIDAIVLACTHYPLVKSSFEDLLEVPSFDSQNAIIDLYATRDLGVGCSHVMTTKDPSYMAKQIKVLFNTEVCVELAQVKSCKSL